MESVHLFIEQMNTGYHLRFSSRNLHELRKYSLDVRKTPNVFCELTIDHLSISFLESSELLHLYQDVFQNKLPADQFSKFLARYFV